MATPASNEPRPIPNMSLDNDGDPTPLQVAASSPPSQSAYQPTAPVPVSAPKPPIEIATPADSAPQQTWGNGDRVFAPWEANFLYAGTIEKMEEDEARGDRALIDFDDGDRGWVFTYSLEKLELNPKMRVFCRRNMGPGHVAAKVLQVEGEEVYVEFDDGMTEWTRIGALRVPCVPNGPGATPTQYGSNRIPLTYTNPGEPGGDASAIPGWVIYVGITVLLLVLRVGCRMM